jgi:hypothetical protein
MKTILITLTASLLLGALALPLVTAEGACERADALGSGEAIRHPWKSDAYIFFDVSQPDKLGEWTELNRAPGLQTVACFQFGAFMYGMDDHQAVLG